MRLTYYRDFVKPTRQGVPDNSRARAAEFAQARSNLGHNVISDLLTKEKVITGYRIYFSSGLIHTALAEEAIREESRK